MMVLRESWSEFKAGCGDEEQRRCMHTGGPHHCPSVSFSCPRLAMNPVTDDRLLGFAQRVAGAKETELACLIVEAKGIIGRVNAERKGK